VFELSDLSPVMDRFEVFLVNILVVCATKELPEATFVEVGLAALVSRVHSLDKHDV
jgi:hypothetical protein